MKNLPICSTCGAVCKSVGNLYPRMKLLWVANRYSSFLCLICFFLKKTVEGQCKTRSSLLPHCFLDCGGQQWSPLGPPEPSKAGGCGEHGEEMAHTVRFYICESPLLLATLAEWPEKGNGDAYRLVHLKNVLSNLRSENQHPLNLDLLYSPVCKDKNKKQKIGVVSWFIKSG